MRERIRRVVVDDPWMFWLLLAVLVLFRLFAVARGFGEAGSQEDIDRFWAIASSPGRPYVDYPVEYPPLTLGLFKLITLGAHTQVQFGSVLIAVSALAEAGMAVMIWRTWGREAALGFLVLDSVLYVLVVTRLDFVSTALALAALAACMKRRPVPAALLIVVAAGTKLWPLALAPLLFMLLSGEQRRRYAVAFVAGGAGLLGAWLALGGTSAVQQVLTFRGSTGWQVESAVGSVVHLITREAPFLNRGTHRFGNVPAGLPEVLLVIAVVVALWTAWRARREHAGAAWIAAVGAFLVCSTLFSPQFVAWLIPGAALALIGADWMLALAVLLVALLTIAEYVEYTPLLALQLPAMLVLVLRNVMLALTVLLALWRVGRGVSSERSALPNIRSAQQRAR